jgi:hypothetical protein
MNFTDKIQTMRFKESAKVKNQAEIKQLEAKEASLKIQLGKIQKQLRGKKERYKNACDISEELKKAKS